MGKYYFLIDSMWGGWAERVVTNLIEKYVKLWLDVYLFTLSDCLFYDINPKVHYIPLSTIKNFTFIFLLIPYFSLKFRWLVKKYWLEDGISFLEISNFVHLLSKKEATISCRIHVSYYDGSLKWKIWKLLIRLLYSRAWKIIVNSRENKMDLAGYISFPLSKIAVMYNPVDGEKIKKLSKDLLDSSILKMIKDKKVFITTWRLVWQKCHYKIINSLSLYKKRDDNWIYLIIWEWPEKRRLLEQVKILWLSKNIIFLWEQKNVFKYLKHANLFLYASMIEWFPNVLLEAREMWLRIISSDFKTWAREIILWEDTDAIWKNLKYPIEWKYWVLIDWNDYMQQIQKYF